MHSRNMATGDADLIHKAQLGDMAAFEQLVHKHDRQVLAIAARYGAGSDDAKDIYQEVFIRVYRGLKRFNMQSEFSTWLHRITVNVCLTHRTQQRRHSHMPIESDTGEGTPDSHAAMLKSPDAPTDQRSVDADLRHHVQSALNRLSPKQRLVFTLKHYEGYKLREIATMMQCTEGTVKRYLFLATQSLRHRLKTVYE
jgi:RNA polymerase sigma-70 factor (ECF subfamily)